MSEETNIPTIKLKNKTLGVTLLVSVPADCKALVAKFGEDVVYNAAVRQTFYGPYNNAFRKATVTRLEEKLSVKRRQKKQGDVLLFNTKKDGTQTPILESEQEFIKYVLRESLISESDYAVLAQEVADTIEFKMAKPGEDEEPEEQYFVAARQILAAIEAGQTRKDGNGPVTEEYITGNLVGLNPGMDFEALGGFNELGLARALEINAVRVQKEQTAGLM